MEAAVEAMRRANAKRVIVAVPTASMEAAEKLSRLADEVVCLETPEPFWSVGDHYRRFPQLSDADVVGVLNRFAARPSEP
jgi:putative phosphoribosyl transferase